MADLKQVLFDEIRRLARKEVKIGTDPVYASMAAMKKQIQEQKKTIQMLQKQLAGFSVGRVIAISDAGKEDGEEQKKIRLNTAGIVRIRKKLKITQGEMARLLGVSLHTVSVWEMGRISPRPAMKAKICALRTMGKRELKKLLAETETETAPAAEEIKK